LTQTKLKTPRHKDYVIENTSSKWRHKNFIFSSPTLRKSWLRSCIRCCNLPDLYYDFQRYPITVTYRPRNNWPSLNTVPSPCV